MRAVAPTNLDDLHFLIPIPLFLVKNLSTTLEVMLSSGEFNPLKAE